MIIVAALLLPLLALLLYGMDLIEDRLTARPPEKRQANGRRLRLIPGGQHKNAHRPARRQPEQQSRAA
ncbi:hypothetical protein [Streptomyces sp. HUAS TT20]|uniref:hypothetical protein n=1 Tax=Streptomyces sp. HUAS TT20 TaxID=3447509 RepID=UPI0021D8606C|nr:hypothetical protein [Streptomyces sp. HUAS 15-9]UXY32152.1 hypothetical protein N8I87_40225 [Streptomyces sp. HUAS 15-9]